LGEIEINYSELVAQRRREAARGKAEPNWIGRARIWAWVLNAALAFRALARLRPVQYLAALIFIVSSVGMIAAYSVLVTIAITAALNTKAGGVPIELIMFGPAVVWLVASPVIGICIALFGRRRSCSRPLTVLRFMGAPARESLRAWDGIFFVVDKKIGRVTASPLRWLLRKPRRIVTVAVILTIAFLAAASGLLLPGHLVSWANQFGRGVKFVGGTGVGAMFWVAMVLIILTFTAMLTYLFLIAYVWFRSVLVAMPLLAFFVVNTNSDYAAMRPFWDPAVRLVSYLPPGIAEAYDQRADNVLTAIWVYLARVFIGNPGAPTTIGMILSGVLIGWLPYVLERLDKPTPRELVARHGWQAVNEQAVAARKHRVFINALWGGGLAVLFFSYAPVSYLISDMEKAGWVTFMLVIIPVGTGLLVMRGIVKKVRKSGQVTRPQELDMSAEETAGTLGEPEKVTSIAENYSPLARLLSEAQRRRSVQPAEVPATV
jgi:hypothetical protein